MRWTMRHQLTSDANADGEVVWFWRPDAGAKFAKTLPRLAGDGGYLWSLRRLSSVRPSLLMGG